MSVERLECPAVDEVRANGDVLNASVGLQYNVGLRAIVGSEAAVGASEGFTHPYIVQYGIEGILNAPAYAAGGALVAGALYAASRVRERVRVSRAADTQAQIREALDDEPVELLCGRGRKPELTLRWFGADEHFMEEPDESSVLPNASGPQLNQLVSFARVNGVEKIALSSRVLDALPEEVDRSDFGVVTRNEELISRRTRRVTDEYADEHVLVATVEQAAKLAEHFQDDPMEQVIAVLRAKDPQHPLIPVYDQWKKTWF